MQRLWSVIDEATPAGRAEPRAYLIACVASSCATVASGWLQLLIGTSVPFMLGLGATFFSAVIGGAGPALLAAAINIGGGLLIARPGADIAQPANLIMLALFSLALALAGERYLTLRRGDRALTWQLRQRERYLQALFNTLPAPIMIVDAKGTVFSINRAAADLFGVGNDRIVDVTVGELIGNDDGVALPGALDRRARDRGEGLWQIAGRRLSGEPLELAIAVTQIRSGGIDLATIYVRDETEMKATMFRLAALQTQLAQLGRASAVAAMGSAIAHELNQPLAAAANFANAARSYLRRMVDPPAFLTSPLDGAVEQLYRAGEIVHGLRDFVRARPTTLQWLNAQAATDEAIGVVRFLLDDRQIKVSNTVAGDLEVWTDRVQIQQVLVNLLTNAVDAIAQHDRREISIASAGGDLGEVHIRVTDSGAGVADSIADKMFDPFVTTKSEGLGVGLSISRQIVEAHKGRIWIDPDSRDTMFCVMLAHRYRSKGLPACPPAD